MLKIKAEKMQNPLTKIKALGAIYAVTLKKSIRLEQENWFFLSQKVVFQSKLAPSFAKAVTDSSKQPSPLLCYRGVVLALIAPLLL